MKQSIATFLLVFVVSLGLVAQDKVDIEKEKSAIKQAALHYAEGYYERNAERMTRALHPLLLKRGLVPSSHPGTSHQPK